MTNCYLWYLRTWTATIAIVPTLPENPVKYEEFYTRVTKPLLCQWSYISCWNKQQNACSLPAEINIELA